MTQFAFFDSTVTGQSPVLGWYDTDEFAYPNPLPAAANLLELTEAQWTAHFADPLGWVVSGGALVPYTPPAPVLTLSQQAGAAMFVGLSIVLSGTLTLAATIFPVDPTTTGKIAAVMTTVNTTGSFPGGATSYPMKDAATPAPAWHTFTLSQYKAVAVAISAYAASLDLIADGNPMNATTLPLASVDLTV